MKAFIRFLPLLLISLMFTGCVATKLDSKNEGWGYYEGSIHTEWTGPRNMVLLKDAKYYEGNKKEWLAPKGAVIDGASIPRPFWVIIGSPFTGKYRQATVFHDVGCDEKVESWQSVHSMFYRAMRASGVPPIKAKTMFAAVWYYADRWEKPKPLIVRTILPNITEPEVIEGQPVEPHKIKEIENWIKNENPSIETIKNNE